MGRKCPDCGQDMKKTREVSDELEIWLVFECTSSCGVSEYVFARNTHL